MIVDSETRQDWDYLKPIFHDGTLEKMREAGVSDEMVQVEKVEWVWEGKPTGYAELRVRMNIDWSSLNSDQDKAVRAFLR